MSAGYDPLQWADNWTAEEYFMELMKDEGEKKNDKERNCSERGTDTGTPNIEQ